MTKPSSDWEGRYDNEARVVGLTDMKKAVMKTFIREVAAQERQAGKDEARSALKEAIQDDSLSEALDWFLNPRTPKKP